VRVAVSLTSANRADPALAAAERDNLDVTRPDARHLAFGHGVHYCVGAPLARIETEIGISTMRGPLRLPVTVIEGGAAR
jgi:cytochrome P450